MPPVPVLEIGGTHVTSALVDPAGWSVSAGTRLHLDGDGDAAHLIDAFVAAAVPAQRGSVWGVAMPDPFDYRNGIGRFEGVGKFTALRGVDVGAALRSRLGGEVAFVNDADAFVLGEWTAGAAVGAARCAGITLGTGVGSGWLVDGLVVDPGLPPGGRIHQTSIDGVLLEDLVSRRAMRRAFADAGGDPAADVREICTLARAGDDMAGQVLARAMTALGSVVGRCLAGFRADVLVVGGSMSASWDVLAPPFAAAAGASPPVLVAARPDDAGLIGAAVHALRAR